MASLDIFAGIPTLPAHVQEDKKKSAAPLGFLSAPKSWLSMSPEVPQVTSAFFFGFAGLMWVHLQMPKHDSSLSPMKMQYVRSSSDSYGKNRHQIKPLLSCLFLQSFSKTLENFKVFT